MNKSEIIKLAQKVNDYWLSRNPDTRDCGWERGAYMIGNLAAYEITGKVDYLDYALRWAEDNGWKFWNDGEYQNTHADNQICGQSYLKLIQSGYGTDEHIIKSAQFTLADSKNDYWWWIDAIYMALPLYTQLGVIYDDRYHEKAHNLFLNIKTQRGCYDENEHLWFRDERYLPEKEKTVNGKKVFWSRGNGWVFAGIARALSVMPENHRYYKEYSDIFKDMAEALCKYQQSDGGYTTSLLAPEDFPKCESSGTALITLGFLMGVRLGLLDSKYLETAMNGLEWLNREALCENGKIGWVQLVAKAPGDVSADGENDYAVGTYLLILKELYMLADG